MPTPESFVLQPDSLDPVLMRSQAGAVPPRRRLPAPERRMQIVEGAFRALATYGFEGLRMRDVAAAVGVNSATLHHYFPTKQDLVEVVAKHLGERFAAVHAPTLPEEPDFPVPLQRLRQEFADAAYCRLRFPELLAASRELALRATAIRGWTPSCTFPSRISRLGAQRWRWHS